MNQHIEHLKYQFNNNELADLARESARASKARAAIEQRQKEIVTQLKADIAIQDGIVSRLSTLIDNGFEYREIECRIELGTPTDLQKTCYRADTGEEVWVKQMTDTDRQMVLDLQSKADAEEAAKQSPAEPIITPPPYVPRLDEPGVVEAKIDCPTPFDADAEPAMDLGIQSMIDREKTAFAGFLAQAAVMGGTHQRKQRKPRDAKREAAADGSEEEAGE